ncbi:Ig-like domain-containing protein [Flavobacterium ovatum]|uniref:Ig-like domain-containing protein n=1 Tax=Flavobacterium ovatum TaxID=1928857 RepID=UPI00344EE2C2
MKRKLFKKHFLISRQCTYGLNVTTPSLGEEIKEISRLLMLTILMMITSYSGYSQIVTVQGETSLKKWDKISLSLTLPSDISETDSNFKDNRMDVVFTDAQGNNIRVPGFFAADGDAANTSATSGKIFKAFLRPDRIGNWTYRVLFYSGTDVALKEVNQLPNPTYDIAGTVGVVVASNVALPDLRAKGRLKYQISGDIDERRYLKWSETGEHFLKFGPDSPENLFDYNDFDHEGNKNSCGLCTEHSFTPHAADWEVGDPTWKSNKGKNLIGAINYLRKQLMNSMSMSLFGGDDKNVFAWTLTNEKYKYDVSKLEQWEIILDHAEKNGLVVHLKLAEAENWNALDANQLKIFYREMVARFGHHLGLEWNISEEFGGSVETDASKAIDRINWLADIDPWQNHRVFHTYPGKHEIHYNYLLANNARITGASIQSAKTTGYDDAYDGKSGIKTWIEKSKLAGTPWVVASDEQNPGSTGMFTSTDINNDQVAPEARTKILWKGLIAGGAGVMWYGGSEGDFKTENFNRFNTLFQWTKIAILQFFEGNGLQYWKMQNTDALTSGNLNRCLSEAGKTYVVYLEKGGTTNLNLTGQTGIYTVKWFDPRNGGSLRNGTVTSLNGGANLSIGAAPDNLTSDWVALITRNDGQNISVTGLSLSQPANSLYVNDEISLITTFTPTNATNKTLTWTTSNPSVATVSTTGIIKGIGIGQATITATTQDGNFAKSATITVVEAPVIVEPDAGCPFEEQNGLLVIEAESATGYAAAKFTLETGDVGVTSPTGAGYLRYSGPNNFNTSSTGNTLTYKIKINNPGTYRFLWRNVRDPQAATSDAGNDAWLLIKGNNVRFYGIKTGVEYNLVNPTKVWIQKSDFVFECYGESGNVNGLSLWADFPTAGEYTIQYAGRSTGHCVDRLMLFKDDKFNDAKNVNTPESARIGVDCSAPTTDCTNVTLNAVDFPVTQVSGFVQGYVDAARGAMAINAAQHKDVFAAVKQIFSGKNGTYNITLTTLAELDGESSYKLKVGGVYVGTYQNPETTVDYTPTTKTWQDVVVNNGDEIQVEFNSNTNGKVPEGTTTAFSRGRWTKLEFACKGATVDPPTVSEVIAFDNFPVSFSNQSNTYSFKVIYTATESREINVAIKSPSNVHIMESKLTVVAGVNKTATVNVTVATQLPVGTNYKFVTAIRPIGGSFATNIDQKISYANITDAPLSVQNNKLNANVNVHPNPIGASKISIEVGYFNSYFSYVITDINGRVVTSGTSKSKNIDISSDALISKGVYILKISDKEGNEYVKKLIK